MAIPIDAIEKFEMEIKPLLLEESALSEPVRPCCLDNPHVDEAELARTERTFESDPDVPEAVEASDPPPYRNPRYIGQCRRDNRRGDLSEAETVESKPDARTRARALARTGHLDPVLVFTRMAYGEEGTPRPGRNDEGYAAMLAVIDYQAAEHRMSRVEAMVHYSPRRIFPHPGESRASVRQRWIAELQLSGMRPPSWPAHRGARWHSYPPWRSYGCPRWLAAADKVRVLLRRHPESIGAGPCEEVPHHWGGDMDDHDDDCHWRVVDCGRTADTFWVYDEVCRVAPGD